MMKTHRYSHERALTWVVDPRKARSCRLFLPIADDKSLNLAAHLLLLVTSKSSLSESAPDFKLRHYGGFNRKIIDYMDIPLYEKRLLSINHHDPY